MKKFILILMSICLVLMFGIFAIGSTESSEQSQGSGQASNSTNEQNNALGDFEVNILECRTAKDYEGKAVVIVKYNFKNNGSDAKSFSLAIDDAVYQNDIGLNKAYVLAESANYSVGNQTKEIKSGAQLDVEVAYELNDTTSDISVEVKELFSLEDKKLTKTFRIQ